MLLAKENNHYRVFELKGVPGKRNHFTYIAFERKGVPDPRKLLENYYIHSGLELGKALGPREPGRRKPIYL